MRQTKKTFSGTKNDLENFLTWQCKERDKKRGKYTKPEEKKEETTKNNQS